MVEDEVSPSLGNNCEVNGKVTRGGRHQYHLQETMLLQEHLRKMIIRKKLIARCEAVCSAFNEVFEGVEKKEIAALLEESAQLESENKIVKGILKVINPSEPLEKSKDS